MVKQISDQARNRIKTKPLTAEILRYLVSGVGATLTNLICVSLYRALFGDRTLMIGNTLAILISICAAYGLNRCFVFRSHQPVCSEFVKFFSSRILISLVFDNAAFWFLFFVLNWKDSVPFTHLPWAKCLGQIAVVVGNYCVGKWYVFGEKK